MNKDLNDDEWHNVTLTRDGRQFVLSVDKISISKIGQGVYGDFHLDDVLFVGGMTPDDYQHYRATATKNFRGCLKDVSYHSTDVILSAEDLAQGYKSHGKVSFRCKKKADHIISSFNPKLSLRILSRGVRRSNYLFNASFQFRTHIKDGALISLSSERLRLKLRLSLCDGVLALGVTVINNSKTELTLGSDLGDGEWHKLTASLTKSQLYLGLDGQVKTSSWKNSLLETKIKFRPKIFLGVERKGEMVRSRSMGFVGCLLNLKIQNRDVSFKDLKKNRNIQRAMRKSCHLEDRCEPNPCKNGGKCSQDWKQFICSCDYTEFKGKTCDVSLYGPTCEHYRSMGLQNNSYCLLDSLGKGNPYTALCNTTAPLRTLTIITHNKMPNTLVRDANLVGSFYKHYLVYTGSPDIDHIKALIEKSGHCRQHIQFRYNISKLLSTSRGPKQAFWLSRDGKAQSFWGVAEPENKKCACVVAREHSFTHRTNVCHCITKDYVWRVYEWYLTDKTKLPVTALLFNKKSKRSVFTLGPLECWGNLDEYSERIEDQKPVEMNGYRLMKACPQLTKLRNPFPGESDSANSRAKAAPQKPKNTSCRLENATLSQNCTSTVSFIESLKIATELLDQRNVSQNISKRNLNGPSISSMDGESKAGIAGGAIVVTFISLFVVICLIIAINSINGTCKSYFPCQCSEIQRFKLLNE